MTTTALKPCPFCKVALTESKPGSGYFTHHRGRSCILDGFEMDADGAPDLVTQWNNRAQLEQAQASAPAAVTDEQIDEIAKPFSSFCVASGSREFDHQGFARALLASQPPAPADVDAEYAAVRPEGGWHLRHASEDRGLYRQKLDLRME